jgi:hypothetical protein
MTSVLSRKRPVLPGETLPPNPVKWPGQPPQLPPVGHQLPAGVVASDNQAFPQWGGACGQWSA